MTGLGCRAETISPPTDSLASFIPLNVWKAWLSTKQIHKGGAADSTIKVDRNFSDLC